MFETALVESAGLLRTTNRKPAMISIAAQGIAVAALLVYPLLHPELLVARHFDIALAHPVPPPPPVVPVPQHLRIAPTTAATNAITAPTPMQPAAPRIDRTQFASDLPATAPLSFNMGTSPGLPVGIGPATSGPSITVARSTGTGTGTGSSTGKPTHISSGVSAGLLLEPIRPVYPAIAIAAHQSGTVTVEAVISAAGRIESAHATSGPIMLQSAAVEAVRLARYRPFMLNGQPTEVNASFSINFNLNR